MGKGDGKAESAVTKGLISNDSKHGRQHAKP